MRTFSIAIIGAGPWGLAVLDRLISRARVDAHLKFDIILVDPSHAGPGMHDPGQPDYLLLNTVTGQIDSFSARHFDEPALNGACIFLDWIKTTHDFECPPNGFLPRKLFGSYLRFVYSILKDNLPSNVRLIEHLGIATNLHSPIEGKFNLVGTNGLCTEADHVFICTGHGLPKKELCEEKNGLRSPYPVQALSEQIMPGEMIGLMGMGLTAVDVVASLTEGRGGRFDPTADGHLRYVPSGTEPIIYSFSRTGTPFSCRPSSTLDLSKQFPAVFCHESRLPRDRKLNFRNDLLPLLEAEMWVAYSVQQAFISGGEAAAAFQHMAFESLTPSEACALGKSLNRAVEFFDPIALLLGDPAQRLREISSWRSHIVATLRYDVHQAHKGEAQSPFKHAVEMLRVVRDFIRAGVNHHRLTPESHEEFFTQVAPRISQLIVGPPVSRGEEWLALIEADILRVDLGPNPSLHRNGANGFWIARSRDINLPRTVELCHLVQAFVPSTVSGTLTSPLLSEIVKSGLCAQMGTRNFKSLRIDDRARPIDATGQTVSGISILGMPSEGATYFNHYLPSPRSRAQVFEQAERAILDMLNVAAENKKLVRDLVEI